MAQKPRAACALAAWPSQHLPGCPNKVRAAAGASQSGGAGQVWAPALGRHRGHQDRENRAVRPAKVEVPAASGGWSSVRNLPAAPAQAGWAGVLKTTDFSPGYNLAWLSLS